jgi:endonuclease YncB( thermonuclease family)
LEVMMTTYPLKALGVAGLASLGFALTLAAISGPPRAPASDAAQPLFATSFPSQTVRVIDGDTIAVRRDGVERRIRLYGIDAPELEQTCTDGSGAAYPCGARAAAYLTRLLATGPLVCWRRDVDRYGRDVADCTVMTTGGAPVQVSAAMVLAGQAVDYVRYSGGAFRREQEAAKAAHSGIWAGPFDLPWEWRAAHK